MAITFGWAVSTQAPAVFDTTLPTHNGATQTGIGLRGADGVQLTNAQHIGNPVQSVIKFDTDRNAATP